MPIERAIVLGGGGAIGVAWEIGVLAGLRDGGVDPGLAGLFIGTSAGARVGASVASGVPLDDLLAEQTGPSDGLTEALAAQAEPAAIAAVYQRLADLTELTDADRIVFGAIALAARTPSENERLRAVEARLAVSDWPATPLRIVAVAVDSGVPVVFDRASGVPLAAAVAASGAVPGLWAPVTINGRRYYDGGFRSPVSADLAGDCRNVIVVAPTGAWSNGPWRATHRRLTEESASLRAAGCRVTLVVPDAATLTAFGPDLMNPAGRAAAARAGLRQGRRAACAVLDDWRESASTPSS